MLYVFRVDTGNMLTLDMNLALETVAQLKNAIEHTCRIPIEKQVLLVSGGECLELTARVCTYSAGTDTNPIYLFSKNSLDSRSLSPTADFGSDGDVTEQVGSSLELPSSYGTVVARASLAQTLCDLGRDLARDCERLVHDQHLQQQGWAAAVANLEDLADSFRDRSSAFQRDYQLHLDARDGNLEDLQTFSSDLQTLALIPILPAMLQQAVSLSGLDAGTEVQAMTLLEWISAKDNQSSLQAVAEQCHTYLVQLDSDVLSSLVQEVDVALTIATNPEMKEIRGLSERLCGLEQLMLKARRIVQEQSEMAQGFQQNQVRASQMGDTSILPDLCASHRRQLLVMLENQTKLKDIRRRCHKAKEELSENLHHRLRWVAYAQNEMLSVGNRLMIYQESLKRARKHFMIVRQVQRAPEMFCLAVAEVVRRKKFSRAFMRWATDLSQRWLATYNEESERRRDFKLQFSGHFLESLFPGLDDEPPTFATKPPDPFDMQLPELSAGDMLTLRSTLPELALSVSWTELSNVAQMLLSHGRDDVTDDRLVARGLQLENDGEFEKVPGSKEDKVASKRQEIECLGERLAAATVALRVELAEIRDVASNERDGILSLVRLIQLHISQLTEGYVEQLDALQRERRSSEEKAAELERTIKSKDDLLVVKEEELALKREEMSVMCREMEEKRMEMDNVYSERMTALEEANKKVQEELLCQMQELKEAVSQAEQTGREAQALYEQTLSEAKSREAQINEELQRSNAKFAEEKAELEQRLVQAELSGELEVEKRVKELETEHLTAIADLESKHARDIDAESERLTLEYKTELAGLRSRFRLMSVTSMEKSPSDSSLEKIERSDMIELVNHEAIVAQTKEDAELQMEKAIAEALNAERELNKLKLEEEIRIARSRMEEEKQVWLQEAVTRALAERERQADEELRAEKIMTESITKALTDKEKQVDALLARQQSLSTECQRHRDTIRLLTDGEHLRSGAGTLDPLLQRVEDLEKERRELQEELSAVKVMQQSLLASPSKTDEMAASVAVVSESISKDAATSPEHPRTVRDKMSKSMRESGGRICITTCNPEDPVLVLWNVEHTNYMILQESPTLFFLHADCLDVLGLRPASDGTPRRMYALATVVNKEYCHARKSENRYKVPKGTKFYRVVVKPLLRDRQDSSLTRSQPPPEPIGLS